MAAKLATGETTSVELTQAHFDQISKQLMTNVHAFLHLLMKEGALAQAAAG